VPISDKAKGCLIVLAGAVAVYVLLIAVRSKVPSGQAPSFAPTLTADQAARRLERQRFLAEQAANLARVRTRQAGEAEARQAAEEAAWLATKAGQIWQVHRDWAREDCQQIAAGSVKLGFTEEQCELSWGAPDNVRRSILPGHGTAVFCYGEFCRRVLYFTDGRLMRIDL
jgi:hypothetical protein